MKRSTKALSLILFILILVLGGLCLTRIKNSKISKLEKRDYLTTYKDFSELKTLDSEYSYSSITYRADTSFELLNTSKKEFTVVSPTPESCKINLGNKTIYSDYIEFGENTTIKYLIKNCAEDSQGNILDVIITLSGLKTFNTSKSSYGRFYIPNSWVREKEQVHPVTNSDPDKVGIVNNNVNYSKKTEETVKATIGSPIYFELDSGNAQVNFQMEYFYHPKKYVKANSNSKYKYDLSTDYFKPADIKYVNGFFYDIDVPALDDNDKASHSSVFNGYEGVTDQEKKQFAELRAKKDRNNYDIRRTRNEGIRPDNTDTATIYYRKNDKYNENSSSGKMYRYPNSTSDWKQALLAEDNGGIRIDDCPNSGTYYSKYYNMYSAVNFNKDSAWYGYSAFMTNEIDNKKDIGKFSFTYTGDGCGITYAFMSPVPYEIPSPKKTVIVKGDKTGTVNKITKGDELIYNISQYVPNLYNTSELNFSKVYTNGAYSNIGELKKLKFHDNMDDNLSVALNNIIIKNSSGEIVTSKFDISVGSGNDVTATLKTDYLKKPSTFNTTYIMEITTRLKSSGVNTAQINNSADVTETYGNKEDEPKTATCRPIYVYYNIQGYTWAEVGTPDGIRNTDGAKDLAYKGMTVYLTDSKGNVKQQTISDAYGHYEFKNLPGNESYTVRFYYNGQFFQSTYYKRNFSGNRSSAIENTNLRTLIQNRFAKISASPNNYGGKYRAYGFAQYITDVKTNKVYMYKNKPLIFKDILALYDEKTSGYYSDRDNGLKSKLASEYGIQSDTIDAIVQYIQDSRIYAESDSISINSISNRIDFGVYARPQTNLSIMNDINGVTYTVNGKRCDETFNKKTFINSSNEPYEENEKKISPRKDNSYYNGNETYKVYIQAADYLYKDQTNSKRNLQMYVTYKIELANIGETYTRVNYINNWYDTTTYNYQDLNNDVMCKQNTYLAYFDKENGFIKFDDLNITPTGDTMQGTYQKLKITSSNNRINSFDKSTKEKVDYLAPGTKVYAFITFKVKNMNNSSNLVIEEGKSISDEANDDLVGKRNIVEIGEYETFYKKGYNVIPDKLDANDKKINKNFVDGMNQGTVDADSNPGSLVEADLKTNGDLNYNTLRIENDTDKSPNLKVKISKKNNSISGTVFEDARNSTVEKASIGNGVYNEADGDTPINGVTLELVEIVNEVNENGFPSESSTKTEKVWSSVVYNNDFTLNQEATNQANNDVYYSGIGYAKTIINIKDKTGGSAYYTTPKTIGKGRYMFDSIPSGDFYVRFKYGDSDRTVLTSDDKNEVNNLTGRKGLNVKSYNGQDYKSTICKNLTSNEINSDTQEKYDEKSRVENGSEARDIYSYRVRTDEYSKTLKNGNSEVLESYKKLAQFDLKNKNINDRIDYQNKKINELTDKTQMVACTRIINTLNKGESTAVNFGLVERPKSQVTLEQEVSNVKVVLANGRVQFDTNKSVKNLYYQNHIGATYKQDKNNRLLSVTPATVTKAMPELIQVYMDDEIMDGAHLEVDYKIVAKNISEVDFTDRKFYYTGVEENAKDNISKLQVSKIINYTSNNLKYDPENANNKANRWEVKTAKEVVDNDKEVNKIYKNKLETYNTILETNLGKNKNLQPEMVNLNESQLRINLTLQNSLGTSGFNKDNLTYNNLMEIVTVNNTQGRKLSYSILGNQEMADQSLGNSAKSDVLTNFDLVQPSEVDSDSSQKVNILPPTGKNENYLPIIIASIISGLFIMASVVLIIVYAVQKKNTNHI